MLIDLSHEIEHGMITYRGLPAPLICDFLSRTDSRAHYAEGTEFQIGRIEMVGNTGTYVDSPFHRYEDGVDLAGLPLESLAHLDAVVIRVDDRAVRASAFSGIDVCGKAVLVQTGWDRNWRTDAYFENNPHLTRDAAEHLAAAGARLVGIDSYNIDDINNLTRPVHTILLGAEVPICEHLCNLRALPDRDFRFTAAPARIRGFGTFPVRAFAVVSS